jgi:glutathione S-transferase
MSDFVVHTIPGSPFARAVLATLEEKGVSYRIKPILPGGQKSEPHLSLNAFGRMPVLQHGNFVLYETQAILRYLDRILPEPSLTPRDAKLAARMDQAMNINDWYLFQGVSNVIVAQRVIFPMLFGLAPDEAAIAEAMPKAHVVFGELARLLGSNKYFGGDVVSLADLSIAPQMDLFVGLPEWEPSTKSHPHLLTWLATMNARPSMKATTWNRVSELAKAS